MSFVENFLVDPKIKLSPPNLLNDPFESHGIEEIKDLMYRSYIAEGATPLKINGRELSEERAKRMIQNNPTNIVARTGIVSLSESNRSLLMWAHYANQHKGIVIGFEDDFLSDIEIDDVAQKKMVHTRFPIKISYDTSRFDLMEFQIIGTTVQDISKQLAVKLLTTKSDDWIYEKEHRYIVPIAAADDIRYFGKTKGRTDLIRRLIADKKIHIDRKTQIVTVDKNVNMDNGLYVSISKDDNFMFYKKINPIKIKSIFFGLRTPEKQIEKFVLDIESMPDKLGHIELFKYKLCDKEFKLIKGRVEKINYLL
ncbi:DUF2971 domain-containing protein [Aeromonas hydrophila]|uniref:DUF2971 domain-containing protein n=1 Tax=Aeromonas hydrophila TaxID=644 RepID=UPI003988866A